MVNLTPLDRITLRATEIKALLAGRGLLNARVVGWAGAGKDFGPKVPAEIQVDLPEVAYLTSECDRLVRPCGHAALAGTAGRRTTTGS